MAVIKKCSVGFVRVRCVGMPGMPDIDVATEIRDGEGVFEAVGRAMAEQQAPPPPKRVRAKVIKKQKGAHQ